MLADDVVVEMPYEAHGYGSLDKAGFRSVLELVLSMYERFELVFERVFELAGGGGAVAEYRSDAVLGGSGVSYRNRYCGVFLVRDGRITHWREYHDPTVVERAMAAHAAATT
jgi:ketosteroid isomerase-like protein